MNNFIKYSNICNKKISKSKLSKIKKSNIDTILLDKYKYESNIESNEELNIKNIIIDHINILLHYNAITYINIFDTNAENIYFNNRDNVGGITYPIDMIKYYMKLKWNDDNICKIKELNIVFGNRKEQILLDETVRNIEISGYIDQSQKLYISNEYTGILVKIETTNCKKNYYMPFVGKNVVKLNEYRCTKESIQNGILDLREINNYAYIMCDTLLVDTLIMNKNQIETLNKAFCERLFVKTLKIIDENNMKLIPHKEIDFDDVLLVKNNYLTNEEKNKIIFLDDKENIRIYDKNEMLENELISEIKFVINSDCDLVIIKYKNNNYKIIKINEEYDIDYLFKKFLELNINSYDFSKEEKRVLKECIKNNDFFTPFEEKIIDNNLLFVINKDYEKFILHLDNLIKIGLSTDAIMYLIDKRYDNIVNTKSNNILDTEDINYNEIKSFNKLGESYKVLRKTKKK